MELYQALITLDGWTFLAQICNLMIQLLIFKKFLLNPVKKVQPSSVINAWYSSISVSFRSFVKGSAYARNFINMPGARKISSRPVTKP